MNDEEEAVPDSPASSAPPAVRGITLPATSLSENPVFKRARGERVATGGAANVPDDAPATRPISAAELEMRFFNTADGAESVIGDDDEEEHKKKKSKKKGTSGPSKGLAPNQIDALVNAAAFGESSRKDDEDVDDGASDSAASSVLVQQTQKGLLRFNGISCVCCALAASMDTIEAFLRDNLGKLQDEAIYKMAAEIYEKDIRGPADREGAETPKVTWKSMQLHFEQHSLDPVIQRHVQLRALQKMRTLLSLSAGRDDGSGNTMLDIGTSNQILKVLREERGLRTELEDLKRKNKK